MVNTFNQLFRVGQYDICSFSQHKEYSKQAQSLPGEIFIGKIMRHTSEKCSQNVLTVASVGYSDLNLSIQPPRSAEGWVQGVWAIGGC